MESKYEGLDYFINEELYKNILYNCSSLKKKSYIKDVAAEINSRDGYLTMGLCNNFDKIYSLRVGGFDIKNNLIKNKIKNSLMGRLFTYESIELEEFLHKTVNNYSIIICNNIDNSYSDKVIEYIKKRVKIEKDYYVIIVEKENISIVEVEKKSIPLEEATIDTKTTKSVDVEVDETPPPPTPKRKRNAKTRK